MFDLETEESYMVHMLLQADLQLIHVVRYDGHFESDRQSLSTFEQRSKHARLRVDSDDVGPERSRCSERYVAPSPTNVRR